MTLALALDVADAQQALKVASDLRPHFDPPLDLVKVGLELFTAEGPAAVEVLTSDGFSVFLDLKLHDIPNTVHGAARSVGALGVSMLTAHASGGVEMLAAAAEGLAEGFADRSGRQPSHQPSRQSGQSDHEPTLLAVTVLTSDPAGDDRLFGERLDCAISAGCGGVVCGAADVGAVKRTEPSLLSVVPGIRPRGTAAHDQRNVATPAAAIEAGADVLVIGRAVTAAEHPAEAARVISAEAHQALSARSASAGPHLS